jgi:hypothetical protein
MDGDYFCFDFYDQLNSQDSCMWKGLFRSGPETLMNLKKEIMAHILTHGPTLSPLIWKSELAHAAADYLTTTEGSRNIPGLNRDDESTADYVNQYFSYDSHSRLTLVPWKFFWVSPLEAVFDLIVDDFNPTHPARDAILFSNHTHIGIACNCHPRLG